jgi:hypothetical protein
MASAPVTAPEARCRGRAREDRELGREPPDLGGVRAHVARRAEEHRVSEREQAAEPDQQVEGAREQREAQRLHEEHRIDAHEGRDRQHRAHDRRRDERALRSRSDTAGNATVVI